jgi:hypothetical protein
MRQAGQHLPDRLDDRFWRKADSAFLAARSASAHVYRRCFKIRWEGPALHNSSKAMHRRLLEPQ